MKAKAGLAGRFTFPGSSFTVNRLGYGAMKTTGQGAWGPPNDRAGVISVLREAMVLGVNHIDTSDYYGPHIANEIIREALYPYPNDLVIVTKIGARRDPDKSWPAALSRQQLTDAVHDNLRNLGKDVLDIVNLRLGLGRGKSDTSLAEPLSVLVDLKRQGLIRHIGLSNITVGQLAEAFAITDIVCVQNRYNILEREDDVMVDGLSRKGVAFVPFFPLGGYQPLLSNILEKAAADLDATPRQVAVAWLLQRSPNILLIPGTSSINHLRENVFAASLTLPSETVIELNRMVES